MINKSHGIHVWYIYLHIYHEHQANAGKYTIHGWYGMVLIWNQNDVLKVFFNIPLELNTQFKSTYPDPGLYRSLNEAKHLNSIKTMDHDFQVSF